ncbi:uncharacterized protein EI97DRAFT_385831 [Westerdykella ornata]|uniref:Uncharacterized protein n=1 Tax=Westerdykella ornata TaxID=318751 RepID=A0A6A6J9W5_WESOR|nr:uncharacterized protein EI97DRAFT_385831 [Westerdykella ornata]KAF2272416.1 hypothetical protein EI97DRAFT_385831 [Westerdykella ornata]
MVPFRSSSRRSRRSRSLDRTSQTSNPLEWQAQRDQYIMTFPVHPLPSMQAPFEESMLDATGETGYVPFQAPKHNMDARQQLLCREVDASELDWNFTYNCHWRNNPKGKFHPLLKTMAQIVFGVHLLHQHLEKSVADVADILLKHVNELDGFLQRANEDIEGSLNDMLFRRKCLKVPMEHVNEFDRLLDDRTYRAQLLDGNVTIERTINRMSILLNDYLIDMSTFRDANNDLDMYLNTIGDGWVDANDDVGRIYSAMCGNTSGWSQFLQSLVAKAEKLGVVLVQVSSYCNEIEKRCGAASRRSLSDLDEHTLLERGRHKQRGRKDWDTSLVEGLQQHSSVAVNEDRGREQPMPKRPITNPSKEDLSPPLTGKDSAYSSLSGGSVASPTAAALPRSTSAQASHPRAQFGLFPSSSPGTPKHSVSGRHGALSPALLSPRTTEPLVKEPVQRSQSSFENYSSSSRRILRKSSLSSIKRLFSKKKHSGADTIAE